ncbi:siroheme decarboxylase subunit beta [Desulfohalobium retbaense]|uniref:siroheme decarboxylase n=1 Tax=Desulfohalobium retbaense (strain ATCC 49708 / DSM 5692 / JCM 16813 / HR100) TaxID=485915 RepID=C8X5K7_DESRD|nr:siroheme decarboxylase subunit beta [Desulfohalobium retbaense]ACV69704.1 putative transcriptional regulator, AsnC family [Desulfohalobium retbaense DSM 5692]
MSTVYEELTAKDKAILRIVQGTLPDSATPFADIAREVGVDEEVVLELLRRLQANGSIRRFGATLRHQQAGYGHNAMVAWYVEDDRDVEQVGRRMAERTEITHCYQRRNCLDWPYNMYTMIHGRSLEDCLRVVHELQAETGVEQYEVLFSDQELKKTSMRYF